MADCSISDEFPDLPSFWTTSNSVDFVNGGEMSYPGSEYSSGRNSLSSHVPSTIDSNDGPSCYHKFVRQPSKIGTPEENPFSYQLPSPLEDEPFVEPTFLDKERRREQNRIAQRAFRERKESKLKQLEKRITELKADHRSLEKKYENLRTAHVRLQSGLQILLDASGTFDGDDTDSCSVVEGGKRT